MSPASGWSGKRMFATTPSEPHRASFRQPSRFCALIPAQPLCIFGNGAGTESSRLGAGSEGLRRMSFSRPSIREAGRRPHALNVKINRAVFCASAVWMRFR